MHDPRLLTPSEHAELYQSIRLRMPPHSPTPHLTMATAFEATPGQCATCGFPPGQPGLLRSDFPPGHHKFGALVACPDCHEASLPERLTRTSQLNGWTKTATFESYRVIDGNAPAYKAALAFANRPRGWLTLWGSYGPGKTHLLAAIVNHCIHNKVAAVYYTLPDLLDKLRDSYGANDFSPLFRQLTGVAVLVIDEADKARLTGWAVEKIYQLIDARYRDLESIGTAFAMNMKPDPADSELGYLFSRMSDRRCQVVQLATGDARPLGLKEAA